MGNLNSFLVVLLLASRIMAACVEAATAAPSAVQMSSSVIERVSFDGYRMLGYIAPRSSEDIQASRWGMNLHLADFSRPGGEACLNLLARTGVKWGRIYLEPEDFKANGSARFDQLLDGLKKHKITPFVTFPTPAKASTNAMPAFQEAVRKVVQKYKDRVAYWEIFNEPNWGGKKMPAKVYAEYVKRGAEAIKDVDPTAKIIGGALAHVDPEFLQGMIDAGAKTCLDILTFHPYADLPEYEKCEPTAYPRLRGILAGLKNRIALWQGECGYPSAANASGFQGKGPWSDRIQGKWITRRLMTDLSEDLPVSVYYELRHNADGRNNKGLLLLSGAEATPKFGYYTLAYCAAVFDSRFNKLKKAQADFSLMDEGSFSGQPASAIKCVAAGGPQGDIFAYWLPVRMQDSVRAARVGLNLSNVGIEDPVLLNLLDGRVYEIPAKADTEGTLVFGNLPVADYAFALAGRSTVKLQSEAYRP